MTREEAMQELQNCKDLIKQYGQDYLDERDIPLLDMAIEALSVEALQVVYCKDCKHKYEPSCQIVTSMYGLKDYDYCSYGEKE